MTTDIREPVKTVDEIRQGTTFAYNPVIMAIKNKKKYDAATADMSKVKTFDIVKDSIRAELLTKEQTQMAHIKGKVSERIFNLYVAGAKATVSFYNKYYNQQKANDKVVREYLRLFDTWGLGGDRGNNGLLVSTDENYITNDNVEIPAAGANGVGACHIAECRHWGTYLRHC